MSQKREYWFRAKNYGWGWYPSSWQGWLTLLVYAFVSIWRIFEVDKMFDTTTSTVWRLIFELGFLTIILIAVCFLKGEKPEFRWAGKKVF